MKGAFNFKPKIFKRRKAPMCKKASHKLVQKQRDDARNALEKYEADLNNIYAKFGGIEN
jgi:hypothetical protein